MEASLAAEAARFHSNVKHSAKCGC